MVESRSPKPLVVGSSPTAPAKKRQVSTETCRFQLYSPFGELYAPSVRDICFASDMPAGVRGEYNITKSEGFYITFCASKIYHSVEDGISLKTNDYVRVRIHTPKPQNIFFVGLTQKRQGLTEPCRF